MNIWRRWKKKQREQERSIPENTAWQLDPGQITGSKDWNYEHNGERGNSSLWSMRLKKKPGVKMITTRWMGSSDSQERIKEPGMVCTPIIPAPWRG